MTPRVISKETQECPGRSSPDEAGSRTGCLLVTQQEASPPGELLPRDLGPHCPVGPLAPASPDEPCPHGCPCPRDHPEGPAPRAPVAHTSRLPHPSPVGTAMSFSTCYGLNCHKCSGLGGTWRTGPCVQMCNTQENAFRIVPMTSSNEDQGQGGLRRSAPSLPGFMLSFPACHIHLPDFFLSSSRYRDDPLTRSGCCEGALSQPETLG